MSDEVIDPTVDDVEFIARKKELENWINDRKIPTRKFNDHYSNEGLLTVTDYLDTNSHMWNLAERLAWDVNHPKPSYFRDPEVTREE